MNLLQWIWKGNIHILLTLNNQICKNDNDGNAFIYAVQNTAVIPEIMFHSSLSKPETNHTQTTIRLQWI